MSDKVPLLRQVSLLKELPEAALASLAERVKSVTLADGAVLFEEGALGGTMYLIASGAIRVFKRAADGGSKDIAILQKGECLGEMELLAAGTRSAGCAASGATSLYELQRADVEAWLHANPEHAIVFFAELARIQSGRLKRTSEELTLLFDASNLVVEKGLTVKALLSRAFGRVVPHLEGEWSGAAFLYNRFNEEFEPAAQHGTVTTAKPAAPKDSWLDERSYCAVLPGEKSPLGYLLFQAKDAVPAGLKPNTGRVLTAAAKLLAAAVENINFQHEDALRARLKEQSHGPGI